MVNQTNRVKLFSDLESRQLLKVRIRQFLSSEMNDITFSGLSVEPNGYIFLYIDLKEKSEEMGELGFSRLVYLSGKEFEDPNTTIEQVIERLKAEIENEKAELLSDWEEVKSIFNKRYENTPEEQVPTRRNKAYVLKEIFNEELHFSY